MFALVEIEPLFGLPAVQIGQQVFYTAENSTLQSCINLYFHFSTNQKGSFEEMVT